jgi:DNA-binding IclR family transcriptional regulator
MDTLTDAQQALSLIGQCTIGTFAERTHCSEKTARRRLERLVKEGYAAKFKGGRYSRGYRYAITTPGDLQILTGRRSR